MSAATLPPVACPGKVAPPAAAVDDHTRGELAHQVQRAVPLVERPFLALGEQFGLDEQTVIEIVSGWVDEGILREISAVLEGSALGYDSALVAGEVPMDRLEEVAEIINAVPTVTHNYLRNHRYNLWFTIAVPAEWGVEAALEKLTAQTGIPYFPLRRTLTFKVGVNFNLKTKKNVTQVLPLVAAKPVEVSDADRRCFRALQTPLRIEARPFDRLADQAGISVEELLAFAQEHNGNALRRYPGTLRHRKMGVRGNGMVVWRVPFSDMPDVGSRLAAAAEVSHCYARNTVPGFDYSLYSMVHGPDQPSVERSARELSARIGVDDYLILFSSREFKKCRLRYFLPELDAWWSEGVA